MAARNTPGVVMHRFIVPCLMLAALAEGLAAQSATPRDAPVAIVARARGEVSAESGSPRRTVRLFERLYAGETIRTAHGAEIVLVFRSGARVRVGEESRVRVETAGATKIEGLLETLSPVPPMPLVAPVAGAGSATAAVRIRARELAVVAPPEDTVTLPDATVLEFTPARAEAYDVEIEDVAAAVAYRVRTGDTRVTVPAGALQAGAVYRWRVTARPPTGFTLRGEGRFRTLSLDEARRRDEWRAAWPGPGAEALSLLAEVDWTIGLWREALDGFRAARSTGADDAVIAERIAELERRAAPAPPGGR